MIKALIPIDKDLGSSIAIRYAGDLSDRIHMSLYDVHVVDSTKAGVAPGSGWVRKTWENALTESEREEIRQFLEMEKVSRPLLKTPKMLFGNRTEKLLEELIDGQYDLFLEGAVPSFNPLDFYTLIHSRLYRQMTCPVLVVKNLVPPEKAALLVTEETDCGRFSTCLSKIFENAKINLDLIVVKFLKFGGMIQHEKKSFNDRLENAEKIFCENGVIPDSHQIIEGTPQKVSEFLRKYGLVASSLMKKQQKSDPLMELLGRMASPILICWD
ncbi:MAG: hypothetical protein COX19_00545 [Desulfobacterales bacterium CG23_combo_of_CG06-09_8_20_14_all_51_8]|nr:MAG: hypothetical protein COX19_00545 [Desulfobacterales bacterium CG23_combo_of_CG06-09_8_20_14_all_51_8]